MEYTELDDYSLPGGRLTTWEPQTAPQAWRDDPRRLSYIHAEHVRRAQSAGSEWYSQWIGTAFWIPGRLDREAMERTILAWYGRHEAFRTTVQEEATHPEDDVTRITVAPEAVTVAGRVVDTALSAEQARAYTAEYFNTTISPLRWPHCVLVTIEPDDGTDAFAVVFAADHTVMDDCHTENLSPPKTHWARPIDTAPFYAYAVRPGVTFTYIGLHTDDTAAVRFNNQPSDNLFVAGFIGQANLWPGTVESLADGHATAATLGSTVGARCFSPEVRPGKVVVMVRPERLSVAIERPDDTSAVQGTVTDLTFQGPVVRLSMRAADGHSVIAHLGPEDHLPGLRPGDRVWAHWPDDAACVLPDAPLPAVDDPDAVDE